MASAFCYCGVFACMIVVALACDSGMMMQVEGGHMRLPCQIFPSNDTITWEVSGQDGFSRVASCYANYSCDNERSDVKANYDNYFSTSYLSVTAQRAPPGLNFTTYKCFVKSKLQNKCDVAAYTRPKSVTCKPPVVDEAETQLSVTCTLERVYPQGVCNFYRFNTDNANYWRVQESVSYKHTVFMKDEKEYFLTECTLTFNISRLNAGPCKFKVLAFPDIPGVSKRAIEETKSAIRSSFVPSLTLTQPTAAMTRCPVGPKVKDTYIMSGTNATCTCMLIFEGIPKGQVLWMDHSGRVLSRGNATVPAILHVSYLHRTPEDTYNCVSTSALMPSIDRSARPKPQVFKPKYALGPTAVTLDTSPTSVFDMCNNQNERKLSVVCRVPAVGLVPGVMFSIFFNGTRRVNRDFGDGRTNQVYTFRQEFPMTRGGVLSIRCRAENSEFRELYKDVETVVEVRQAPPSAPHITVNFDNPASDNAPQTFVETGIIVVPSEAIDVTVSCAINGGVPNVYDIMLSCGFHHVTQKMGVASLKFRLTKDMEGEKCSCMAQHVTGCYEQTTELRFVNREDAESMGLLSSPRTTVEEQTETTVEEQTESTTTSAMTTTTGYSSTPLGTAKLVDNSSDVGKPKAGHAESVVETSSPPRGDSSNEVPSYRILALGLGVALAATVAVLVTVLIIGVVCLYRRKTA